MKEKERLLKVARIIRREWHLSNLSCSDEDILRVTEGTFFRVRIELGWALEDLKNEIKKVWLGRVLCWCLKKINKRR